MKIDATGMHFKTLNESIRSSPEPNVIVDHCVGQRYIGSGSSGREIVVNGTPGNALGAYLDGSNITVYGNAQDATGDTMNDGSIYIHGSSGDATGYAMRGGRIFIEGNTGYRAGIHMKAYRDKIPVLVVGGRAGSFLGEYQAGGVIVVLGIGASGEIPVGNFCGAGMHGGKMFLRCESLPKDLPAQVDARSATPEDLAEIKPIVQDFCRHFGFQEASVLSEHFYVLTPDTKNPYQQLYTVN